MIIRLEHNGVVIQETEAAQIKGEILIGRGHPCAWRIPEDDRNVSSVHLVLFRRGHKVWVREPEPPSKNGSFFHGQRVKKPVRLSVGDKVVFGACVLFAEGDKGGGAGKPVPEVVVLSGRSRGQMKPVVRPRITIGSDPASTVVLLDDMVSRSHAEITLKEDGSCWLRDLKSKNGTSVNGMPLHESQERLLKDGDRIGIAHMELRFQDGTLQRSGRKILLGLSVLGLTLALASGAYWTWKTVTPRADKYIITAKTLAANGDFSLALVELEGADGARDAEEKRGVVDDLRRQIGLWQTTVSIWTSVTNNLQGRQWRDAARDLGTLGAKPAEAWRWGPQGEVMKKECGKIKSLLDAMLRSETMDDPANWNAGTPSELSRQLQIALEDVSEYTQGCYADLIAESRICLERMGATVQLDLQMEEVMNGLNEWPPGLKQAVTVLEDIQRSKSLQLRDRAERLIGPVRRLAGSLDQLHRAMQLTTEANFDEALKIDLDLPPSEMKQMDPRLATAWDNLCNTNKNLKQQVSEAKSLLTRLKKLERELPTAGGLDPLWRMEGNVQNVLNCDTLGVPYSKDPKDRPLGQYDRYLGIEYFSDFLQALNDPATGVPTVDDSLPKPLLVLTSDLCDAAGRFQTYMDSGAGKWMNTGALAGEVVNARAILDSRNRIVMGMMGEARKPTSSGRRAIIAAGIACRLSPDRSSLKIGENGIEAWIGDEMKKLKEEVRQLAGKYEAAQSQDQLVLREKILSVGLLGRGGDAKRMWIQKYQPPSGF